MNALIWMVRGVALIIAIGMFLGFSWWSREELGLIEKLFWLAPAAAMILMAILPLHIFILNGAKVAFSAIAMIAIGRLGIDVVSSATLPIEPDMGAVLVRLIAVGMVAFWLWLIWIRPIDAKQ